jgi:Tfp pilus assembly protein PilF
LRDNNGVRVWSDNFDHASNDLIAIEDKIAATVAATMGEAIEAELARTIIGKSDDALTPHQMLVRGADYMHRINPADNLLARGYIERALDLAPKQSRLHGALAATYVLELVNGWPPSRKDMQAHCRQYLGESLRADDRSPLLHRLMSRFYAYAGDGDKALAHSERAMILNPYDSDIIYNHALSVAYTGDVAKAATVLERALSINPYAPPYYRSYLSLFYFLTGRAGDGLAVLGSIDETVGPTWVVRIANLVGLNRTGEAHEEAKSLMAARPEFTVALAVQGLRTVGTAGQRMLSDALLAVDLPKE